MGLFHCKIKINDMIFPAELLCRFENRKFLYSAVETEAAFFNFHLKIIRYFCKPSRLLNYVQVIHIYLVYKLTCDKIICQEQAWRTHCWYWRIYVTCNSFQFNQTNCSTGQMSTFKLENKNYEIVLYFSFLSGFLIKIFKYFIPVWVNR